MTTRIMLSIAAAIAATAAFAASSTVATRDWVEKFVAAQIGAYDAETTSVDDGSDSGDGGGSSASSRTNACLVVRKSSVAAVPFGTFFYKSGADGSTNVFSNVSLPKVRVLYAGSLTNSTVEAGDASYFAKSEEGGMTYFYSDATDGFLAISEALATDAAVKEGLGK